MTLYAVTLTTAVPAQYICDINKKRDFRNWSAGVIIAGTFGAGTVNLFISPDKGTTKIPWFDASGVAITSTANDNYTLNFDGGAKNSDAPQIYVTLTGSTGATVTVYLYDNNG